MIAELKGIIKYIENVYQPAKIEVTDEDDEKAINVYFDVLDEELISNPLHKSLEYLMRSNMKKDIRKDIYNYFGVMTSGLSLEGFAPYVKRGLTINVLWNKKL